MLNVGGLQVVVNRCPEVGTSALPLLLQPLFRALPVRCAVAGCGGDDQLTAVSYRSVVAPGGLPLAGHSLALVRSPLDFIAGLADHGDLVRIGLGPHRAYVACHPGLVRDLLTDDRTFDKGGPLFGKLREVVGGGLASCPAPAHRRQRRLVQPAFHRERMPGYAGIMAEEIAAATASWRHGEVLDVPAAMYCLTTARCLFTVEARADGLPLHESMDIVTQSLVRRLMVPAPGVDRLPTPGNRRFRHARAGLRDLTDRLIAEYRASGADRHDLLSMLLAAEDDDGRGLADSEIHDQVVTFLLAGMETTASLLTWAWYLLDAHPAVEEQLHAEVDEVLGGRPAGHADLPALGVTGRILAETLRLYPPAWLLTRATTRDTELGGHPLRAGTTVMFSPYPLHRRADVFPDPERFDPDRWLSAPKTPPGAFTPFGGGARRCIGDTFGLIEATLALAGIAGTWQLTAVPGQRVRPARSAVLTPRAFSARLTRRRPAPGTGATTV